MVSFHFIRFSPPYPFPRVVVICLPLRRFAFRRQKRAAIFILRFQIALPLRPFASGISQIGLVLRPFATFFFEPCVSCANYTCDLRRSAAVCEFFFVIFHAIYHLINFTHNLPPYPFPGSTFCMQFRRVITTVPLI